MDHQNYLNVKKISAENWTEDKVDYLMNEVFPGKNISIPDPWFEEENEYHNVYKMIDKACDAYYSQGIQPSQFISRKDYKLQRE